MYDITYFDRNKLDLAYGPCCLASLLTNKAIEPTTRGITGLGYIQLVWWEKKSSSPEKNSHHQS